MGFYGNITNTSRTQFQFDKTFPNRKVMDQFIGTDGVYVGRYVLVEYDKALAADWTTVAYKKTVNGVPTFYTSPLTEENTRIRYGVGNIQAGKYIKVPGAFPNTDGKYVYYDLDEDSEDRYIDSIYEILSTSVINETPKTKNITKKNPLENDYIINFNIDRAVYGGGRGYDSTVWQKVYADGIERYVMIAELNSVVPTFSVSADAPTLSPIAPHFDVDSTNIFYRVHWQPSWGLRVKSAAPSIKTEPIDDTGKTINGGTKISMSTELPKKLPSDETTIWTRSAYDTSKNQQLDYYYRPTTINKDTLVTAGSWLNYNGGIPEGTADIPAAIYYNKAGFDPAYINYSEDGMADKITIEPTGLSGHQYNVHDATGTKKPQIDTQEISIMLPSLGNSLAKIWDLIYGSKEVNHGDKVFTEGEKVTRNTYIEWTAGSLVPNTNGLRLVTKTNTGYGYEPSQAETLAGAINSVHDLMGMLIQEKPGVTADVASSTLVKWGEDYIYYLPSENRYYKKHKTYSYPDSKTGSFNKKDYYTQISSFSTWPADGYYYADYAETNLAQPGGLEVYPNYIKEKKYDPDKTYYKTIKVTGNPITKFAGGSFEPYKFYISVDNVAIKDSKGEDLTVSAYRISQDKTFNSKSGYLKITHKVLPTNTRFWNKNEKYYTATFEKVAKPTQNQLDSQVLFILKDGLYTRANTSSLEEGVTYYTPTSFNRAVTFDKNKQHFMVSKKTQGDIVYIEKIFYEKFSYTITAANFADEPRYYWNGSNYVLAESFVAGTEYFEEKITLTPTQGEEEVKPENIIEITLKNIEDTPEIDGVRGGVYAQYAPKSYSGFDQYYVLNLNNCYRLTSNLVVIYITSDLEIYQPNLYYYQIKDEYEPVEITAAQYKADTHYYLSSGNYVLGSAYEDGTQYYVKHSYQGHPLYGSYVFDSNALPTAGRDYYAATSVGPGDSLNYNSTPVYEPFKYYYSSSTTDTNYILSTSKTPVSGKIYWKRTGLYVKADTNGIYPIGMEWNMNATTIPSGVTLSKRNEVWELQELKGFARHFNTIHGLILRMNSALESENELIRDFDTVQGVINKMKDIIVQFGEIYPNQIAVTDQYGRITTTTFKDDDWIYTNYTNDSVITINHQYIGTDSTKGKTLAVNGETANKTIAFGGSFTSPSFSLRTDNMGHANEFSTSSKTITMPTLSFTPDTTGNVVTDMAMAFNEAKTLVTFTEYRADVGSLALTDYAMTSGETNVTKIAATDSINAAFAKINTALNGLDLTTVGSSSDYIISVGQSNGKLSATKETKVTTLNATSANLITSKAVYDYLANTYAGTQNITTLGTITTGVWNGTAIASGKIANSAITTAKINDGAVTSAKIADGAVTSAKIEDGTIATGDIANSAITNVKVAAGIAGAKISMTDYTIGTTAKQSIAASDTLIAAIGKLEKRIADLETQVQALSGTAGV